MREEWHFKNAANNCEDAVRTDVGVTSRGVSVDGRLTGCSRLPPAASLVRITGVPKLPSFSDVEFTKL